LALIRVRSKITRINESSLQQSYRESDFKRVKMKTFR
jgi:hypothetical protein